MIAVSVAPAAAATVVHAQTLREYSSTRQDHGESRLAATVQYAGGTLNLVPAPAGILYALRLTYDADRFAPVARFDPAVPRLTLGTEALARSGGVRVSHRGTPPAATIGLGTRADLDLDIELGAAEATLELGGIRISRLKLQTGASKTVVRFSESNPIRCSGAEFSAGAAELMVTGLGLLPLQRSGLQWRGRQGDARLQRTLVGADAPRRPAWPWASWCCGCRGGRGSSSSSTSSWRALPPPGSCAAPTAAPGCSAGFENAPQQLVVEVETAFGGVTVEWID